MTFKYSLGATLSTVNTTPIMTGIVHARTEYNAVSVQPSYQVRWRDDEGRINAVWFNEDHLTDTVDSSPPQ